MPVPANPNIREFYVYQFSVRGYPYYVGIGRSTRDTDRERYVRSLLKPHNAEKLSRASLSVRVMADLMRRNKFEKPVRLKRNLMRKEALEYELKKLKMIISKGFHLTNWHHNPRRHTDDRKAVRDILSNRRTFE